MNNISKIIDVLKTTGQDASLTEIVAEFSRKYHITNDSHLFYMIKIILITKHYISNLY